MSIGGVLLGIINIAIVVALLVVVGLVVVWACSIMGIGYAERAAAVGLIALYMLVALAFRV